MTTQVWSNDRILNEMHQACIEMVTYEAGLALLIEMRDEYEDELDKLREEMASKANERGDDD